MGRNISRKLQCHFRLFLVQYSSSSFTSLQHLRTRSFPRNSGLRQIRSNCSCPWTHSLSNWYDHSIFIPWM